MKNYDVAISYGIDARNKSIPRHDKNVIGNDLLNIYEEILLKK